MTERRVGDTERPLADPDGNVQVNLERTGEGTVYRTVPNAAPAGAAPAVATAPAPVVNDDTALVEMRRPLATAHDRVRFMPIFAGLLTAITTMVVAMFLGLAVGLSVFGSGASGNDIGTGSYIWTAVSAALSLLLGGWVAGETAAVASDGNALLNGFLVGAATLVMLLWMATSGIGNLLGGIGNNIAQVARSGLSAAGTQQINNAGQSVQSNAGTIHNVAQHVVWGTWIAIVVGLALAALGGWIGYRLRGFRIPYNETN